GQLRPEPDLGAHPPEDRDRGPGRGDPGPAPPVRHRLHRAREIPAAHGRRHRRHPEPSPRRRRPNTGPPPARTARPGRLPRPDVIIGDQMLQKFLFVGVGGSGGVTLRALRALLQDYLAENGYPEGIPAAWQFVHIDVPLEQDRKPERIPLLPRNNYVG